LNNKGQIRTILQVAALLLILFGAYSGYQQATYWQQNLAAGILTSPYFVVGIVAFVASFFIAAEKYGECPSCKEKIIVGAEKCRFCGQKVKWSKE